MPRAMAIPHYAEQPSSPKPLVLAIDEQHVVNVRPFWQRAGSFLCWIWLAGTALCATIALTRVVRFYRRVQHTLPASERLRGLGRDVALRFGVSRQPDIRYVDSGGPLVCRLGRRSVILLPIGLFRQLDDEQASMILAHEVAHLCRRDHWVRLIELVISTVYWWNPLVWFVRRQMHRAEESCCDAWVRWAFPESAKRYAEVILLAADSINSRTSQPVLASSLLRGHSMKARIEMILQSRFAPRVSFRAKAAVGLLAFIALPVFAQSTNAQKQPRSDGPRQASGDPSAQPEASSKSAQSLRDLLAKKFVRVPDTPATSDFPHVVRFEQGASKLLSGDRVDITEVRGTAETMTPGNVYWIKGTYTLASHDQASLMVGVTAARAADGTGPTLKVQSVAVTKGSGTFTLLYPMTVKGWPHVSFYPPQNGGDFGGTHFGTGEFVLRHWWGEAPTGNVRPPRTSVDIIPDPSRFRAPSSVAERAAARLVLVFYQDRARRAVGGMLVDGGGQTLIVTAGSATLVPDGTPHAIDRAFVERGGKPAIEAVFAPRSTVELAVYHAEAGLTSYKIEQSPTVEVGDLLDAVVWNYKGKERVEKGATAVRAIDREAKIDRVAKTYKNLLEIDRGFPEGTPLFKEGRLVGLTIVGTRFLNEDAHQSYVLPAERLAALCREIGQADPGSQHVSKREPEGPVVPAASEFPYKVQFESGETQFLSGDNITISEVRGTAERMIPGHLYWIKGTYRLASHERAMLCSSVSAENAANGTATGLDVQNAVVDKGDRAFTLFLPMSYKGWPHVSFYPAGGGNGFGGAYFGTGDSILNPSPKLLSAEDSDSQQKTMRSRAAGNRLWVGLGLRDTPARTGESASEGTTAAPKEDLAPGPAPKLLPPEELLAQRLWGKLGLRLAPITKSEIENLLQEQRKQWELIARSGKGGKSASIPASPLPYAGGVRIVDIAPDSPASRTYLPPMTIIVGVDRFETVNPQEVLWVLDHRQQEHADPDRLHLLVIRDARVSPVDILLGPQR